MLEVESFKRADKTQRAAAKNVSNSAINNPAVTTVKTQGCIIGGVRDNSCKALREQLPDPVQNGSAQKQSERTKRDSSQSQNSSEKQNPDSDCGTTTGNESEKNNEAAPTCDKNCFKDGGPTAKHSQSIQNIGELIKTAGANE